MIATYIQYGGPTLPVSSSRNAESGRARDVITHILPVPRASLLNGILLGDHAGLPADVANGSCRRVMRVLIAVNSEAVAFEA